MARGPLSRIVVVSCVQLKFSGVPVQLIVPFVEYLFVTEMVPLAFGPNRNTKLVRGVESCQFPATKAARDWGWLS